MRNFIIHLFIMVVNIYGQLYDNDFFQMENMFQNSIILTFKPEMGRKYDIKIAVWPPVINVSEEGGEDILFYEVPTYIDMESISAHRKGDLVHLVLPKRMLKINRLPNEQKVNSFIYQEIDPESELSQLL